MRDTFRMINIVFSSFLSIEYQILHAKLLKHVDERIIFGVVISQYICMYLCSDIPEYIVVLCVDYVSW